MKIASRLMLGATVLTALAVVGSAGTTGWLALNHSSQAVEAALQRQFQTTAAGREEALLRQFESFGELLQSQAHSRMTQEALYGFVRPFDSYRYEVPATINIAERSEEHTSELQSRGHRVCRLLLHSEHGPDETRTRSP